MTSRRFHFWMIWVWAATLVPTLLWWRESLLWIAFMSLYAIVVGHWGAFQASHAEEKVIETVENAEIVEHADTVEHADKVN